MDRETALFLNRMTCDFYRANAASFSATRQAPWDGWHTLADLLRAEWNKDSTGKAHASGVDANVIDAGMADMRATHSIEKCDAAGSCDARPTSTCDPLSIVDLACGNLRFEQFLASEFPGVPFIFRTWDNCDELIGDTLEQAGSRITFIHHQADIVEGLIGAANPDGAPNDAMPDAPTGGANLAVCFGFFHHIPTPEARARALEWLLTSVRPGGIVAISLWRFADDGRTRAKAELATERALSMLAAQLPASYACTQNKTGQNLISPKRIGNPDCDAARINLVDQLEPGDYLLGWKDTRSSFRYCHSFSDEDIDRLIESIGKESAGCAKLIARFRADGKDGRSNEYLVFQKSARKARTEGFSGASDGEASDNIREGA